MRKTWLAPLVLAAAGCAVPGAPQVTPTAQPPERAAATPALYPIAAEWYAGYRAEVGLPGFDLDVATHDAGLPLLEAGEVLLLITGREPPAGWFATPLATEPVAIVVHPGVPVLDFGLEELRQVFGGQVSDWGALGGADGLGIQPVIPLRGDELRVAFEALVLEGLPHTGRSLLAPHPAATLELVAGTPGAIGYMPASLVTDAVRTVRVGGVLPGDGYPLAVEILAIAPQEPRGEARDWLVWIQGAQGPGR